MSTTELLIYSVFAVTQILTLAKVIEIVLEQKELARKIEVLRDYIKHNKKCLTCNKPINECPYCGETNPFKLSSSDH